MRRDGYGATTLIWCWKCGARLDDVEAATGISKQDLLGWPPPAELGSPVGRARSSPGGPPDPLPSLGYFGGCHSGLLSHEPALNYLFGRGISSETILRYEVGWDRDRNLLVFPMYYKGELVAYKTRAPRDGAQMRNPRGAGRPWPLYPGLPYRRWWVLVVGGELDALAGLSAGLPAVSVTLGVGHWRPDWTEDLRPFRLVTVCLDNNEVETAERRAQELRRSGIRARQLDLRTLGLAEPKGDLSDYLNSGGDPKRIKPPGRRRA
jgi:hypothetical protein